MSLLRMLSKKSCISITNVLFYAMRYNDAKKTLPTPSHMRHSHSFDKIGSFLKPDL